MRVLLQRVQQASVVVDSHCVGEIGRGLLIYGGLEKGDTPAVIQRMAERVLNYRVFPDAEGRMNQSLLDVGGGILLISQFTLAADTRRGNRPGFSTAMPAELAEQQFEYFIDAVKALSADGCKSPGGVAVASGQFQADMQVSSINDGPINFILEVSA